MAIDISIGTADNQGDGITIREAFRRVRKNIAEIYGDTDAINLTDSETLPSTTFETHIVEKIQDTVGAMISGNTETNITVTYDDSSGKLNFDVAADIEDVAAGDGLSGGVSSGTGTISLDLNDLTAATVDVATDSIAIIDSSDSNASRKETIADLATAMAGTGLSASNGQITRDEIDTDDIAANAINGAKLEQFVDDLSAATSGHMLISDGSDFDNVAITGVLDITSAGVTSFDSTVAGSGITDTSGVLSLDVDDSTVEVDATNGLQIKADGVDHDQLADRYTETSAETSASTLTLNKANADTFTWTAGHSVTVSFSSVKKGDTATLVVTGGGSSYTFALSQINSAAATFNKISGTYDDTSGTKNLIEFKFVSTSEAWYQISQIAS